MPARPASSIYLGCLQHGVRASPAPERGAPNPPKEPGAAPSPHHPQCWGMGTAERGQSQKLGEGRKWEASKGCRRGGCKAKENNLKLINFSDKPSLILCNMYCRYLCMTAGAQGISSMNHVMVLQRVMPCPTVRSHRFQLRAGKMEGEQREKQL